MNTTEVKSFRFKVEKLDGGFISDVTGKRKIFNDAYDVTNVLGLEDILNKVEDDMYHLNIDLIPNDKMSEYVDLMTLHTQEKEEELTVAKGIELGIIEPAEKFNPHPVKEEPVIETDIKVTATNAFKAGRLKQIDWKLYDEQLQLTNAERAEISGLSAPAMYAQWRKAKDNKASYHLTQTRIAMTILAKYYEAHIGVRSSTKDQFEKLKEDMLTLIRELELVTSTNKFVKNTVVLTKLGEMRKHLL